MLYYNIFITAVLFALFIICIWNLYLLKRKKYPAFPGSALPFVSILVPARNEEHNIGSILGSLLKQDYPEYEVIVLNDSSEDTTGEIINEISKEFPRLKILNGKPLISGWTGKCYACKQLFDASKGEYILFTDADTIHNPDSLRDSVTIALNRKADMLTLFPKMIMRSFGEKLIMPMLWFTVMMLLPFYFVDKKGFTKFSIGIGPFMMFRRKAYEQIGGHESVKDAIVEDVWLARKIKEKGLQLIAGDGQDIFSVRMYRSFREIWNGFSKNIFAGFEYSTLMLFGINFIYILLFSLPFLLFFIALSSYNGLDYAVILTGMQIAIIYLSRMLIAAKFKLGVISSFLHPFGAFFVPVIAFNSWRWIKSGKGAKWKGRTYNPVKK